MAQKRKLCGRPVNDYANLGFSKVQAILMVALEGEMLGELGGWAVWTDAPFVPSVTMLISIVNYCTMF